MPIADFFYPGDYEWCHKAGLESALNFDIETAPYVKMPMGATALAPHPTSPINKDFIGKWFHCLKVAAESTETREKRPYIYRMINEEKMSLGLMTPEKAAAFHRAYGQNQLCEKLSFSEVIQVTRHFIASNKHNDTARAITSTALEAMAVKADTKYSGFIGIIRRIASIFHNFLLTDVAVLFSQPIRHTVSYTKQDTSNFPSLSNKMFWGSDAKFARLVVRHYCQDPAQQ